MSSYRFEVYRRTDNDWGVRLVAGNGEIVLQGEGYTRKGDARRAVRRIKTEVWRAPVEVR